MDLPTFRNRFGEFEATEDGPILACLDAAAAETNADAWGDRYGEAHGLLAAHKLALGPYGTAARWVTNAVTGESVTTYQVELGRMLRGVLSLGVT